MESCAFAFPDLVLHTLGRALKGDCVQCSMRLEKSKAHFSVRMQWWCPCLVCFTPPRMTSMWHLNFSGSFDPTPNDVHVTFECIYVFFDIYPLWRPFDTLFFCFFAPHLNVRATSCFLCFVTPTPYDVHASLYLFFRVLTPAPLMFMWHEHFFTVPFKTRPRVRNTRSGKAKAQLSIRYDWMGSQHIPVTSCWCWVCRAAVVLVAMVVVSSKRRA